MEINIVSEKEEPLLQRKEFLLEINFEAATPSKESLKQDIAKKIKANENLMIIKNIDQNFGARTAKVLVQVYSDERFMNILKKKQKEKKAEGKQ